jgi:hypothetical protein
MGIEGMKRLERREELNTNKGYREDRREYKGKINL